MKLQYNRKTGHIQSSCLPYEWNGDLFVFKASGTEDQIAAFCASGTCIEDEDAKHVDPDVAELLGWSVDSGTIVKIPAQKSFGADNGEG